MLSTLSIRIVQLTWLQRRLFGIGERIHLYLLRHCDHIVCTMHEFLSEEHKPNPPPPHTHMPCGCSARGGANSSYRMQRTYRVEKILKDQGQKS
jgi:hypothetical protein